MANKPKNKVYLVETEPDQFREFNNWPACQAFVKGKPFAFAGGVDYDAAMSKLLATRDKQYAMKNRGSSGSSKQKQPSLFQNQPRPKDGLTSDAGTHGNPGPCEYQVTDIKGKVLAHRHLGVHTNNYAELAGIEAMIEVAIKRGETILWTDSQIALGWIKSQRLGPTVREPDLIMGLIKNINQLLKRHPQIQLRKWETKAWGQIPSDFGRK